MYNCKFKAVTDDYKETVATHLKNKRMTRKYIVVFILILHSFCGMTQVVENRFRTIIDTIYENNEEAVGVMVHVESPDKNISWTYAVGVSNRQNKDEINKEQPALIASNTKTYVAASILKLVENHKLNLDQPIKKLLKKKTCKALKKSGYNTNEITVRNLLSHTSGITDYVNKDYWKFINDNPNYQWTRNKQIDLAMQIAQPIKAGTSFEYGDINYLLLTEIIEKKTKKEFNLAIRELLAFETNKLNNTWFETLDKRPKDIEFAHQYSNKKGWDSFNLNPSWDLFGGGGLASTTKDVARFYQLLFSGQIVKDKDVLGEMTKYVLPREESKNYALGIYNIPSFFGTNVYYHGGWWGTDAIYIPEVNTSIAIFILQKEKRDLSIEIGKEIIKTIKNVW